MAELVLIGPLANIGIYLTKWLWKKWKEQSEKGEHTNECQLLLQSIDSLSVFIGERLSYLEQLRLDLGLPSDTLSRLDRDVREAFEEVEMVLESKKLKWDVKRARIEGVHSRLTQRLVVDLGVLMVEVCAYLLTGI